MAKRKTEVTTKKLKISKNNLKRKCLELLTSYDVDNGVFKNTCSAVRTKQKTKKTVFVVAKMKIQNFELINLD